MGTIKYMIQRLLIVFTTIKPIGVILIAILAFFAPVAGIVHGILILIALDLITGVMAYFKKHNLSFCMWKAKCWRPITSHGLGQTLSKTIVYLILIITGFIIDTLILPGGGQLITKILSGAVALRELKSLVENGEIILGGGIIAFIKAVANKGFKGAMSEMLKENEDIPQKDGKDK